MEQTFNPESMDSSMTPDFGHELPQIDPNLESTFVPTTANEMSTDAAPQDSFYHKPEGLTTPDSIAPQPEPYHEAPIVDTNEAIGTDADAEGEDIDEGVVNLPEHWRTLVDFEIPDHTQTHLKNIPRLQALCENYLINYSPLPKITSFTRMQYAQALMFVLLTHYYPTSQGYTVTPTSLGPIAAHGMQFILAAEDNSDIWVDLPRGKAKASKKKKKKRAPTQAELDQAEKDAKTREWEHGIKWLVRLKYDRVPPEDIAAFVVVRKTEVTGECDSGITHDWQPYTYSAIIIPNWDIMPRYSVSNDLHRSHVLVDAMSRGGNIKDGYGILLYGPMLEFYNFAAGADWVYREDDDNDEDEDDEESQDMEPKMELIGFGERKLTMDVRDTELGAVDEAFKLVAVKEVSYREAIHEVE